MWFKNSPIPLSAAVFLALTSDFKVPISLMGSLRIWKEHKKLVNKFFNIF